MITSLRTVPAVSFTIGHDLPFGDVIVQRVEIRATHALRGEERSSWTGTTYRVSAMNQLTIGFGIGVLGPL